MSVTIVETTPTKSGSIAIRPYFDPAVSNMGLEKYGLSLWDGTFQEEQLGMTDMNGVKRYITGLNEFAPEVKNLPQDLRESRIKDIRKVVSKLEKDLANNVIPSKVTNDVNNEEFWNHVKMLKSDNDDFWSRITIRCGNEPVFLDPEKPFDLIKIYAIEAGGSALVARSYEDARSRSTPPKFYLDKYQETVSTTTELTKIKNKALAELQNLFDSNQTKLFYVAKVVDGNSAQYKKSTPNDVTYQNMDKFINGEGVERSKKRAAGSFLEAARQDMETLKLRAIVKDATFYKFIALKSDGFIYHMKSAVMLGRTTSDIIEFLKNPLNDQVLNVIMKETERLWN